MLDEQTLDPDALFWYNDLKHRNKNMAANQQTGVDATVERILTASDYHANRRAAQAVVRTALKKVMKDVTDQAAKRQ